MKFINRGDSEDTEWEAHINILNKWTEPDRYLRQIIQYARSGPFYPADMHVDLINQVLVSELEACTIPPDFLWNRDGVTMTVAERIKQLKGLKK